MSDREFDNINGIKVCDQTARNKIPTKTSQLENDSDYATITQVNQAIDNAQLGGTSYDDTAIRADINTIKTDLGTTQLTTTAKDVKGAVNEVNSQIKEKANKGNCELHVGVNQEFTSIQSAINNVASEKNVIIVHEGQYKEKIVLNEINVTIKGVDKDLVTIWNDKGRYGEEPVLIRGGNVKISNMSILSKHEDIGEDNGCYALHIDRSEDSSSTYSPSKVIIENCNITSYNHAGAGCGTENNQTIKFIDCNISSYKNCGLLYHTSIVNMENQKFSVVNCNLFSDTFFPLFIKNDTPNSSGFEVEFINNNLVGNNPYTQGTGHENNILNALTKNSYGNNDKKINYNSPKQMYQLTNDNGTCMDIKDLNNATLCGFYSIDATKGGLNCPTNDSVYIAQTISYSTSGFLVQYAWSITGSNMYKKYKRGKDANAWSSWVEVSE